MTAGADSTNPYGSAVLTGSGGPLYKVNFYGEEGFSGGASTNSWIGPSVIVRPLQPIPWSPPPADPADPTTWTPPTRWVQTGLYSDYLECVSAEWAITLSQDAAEWTLVGIAPFAAMRGYLANIMRASPQTRALVATAVFAAASVSKAREIRDTCTSRVYGPRRSSGGGR